MKQPNRHFEDSLARAELWTLDSGLWTLLQCGGFEFIVEFDFR